MAKWRQSGNGSKVFGQYLAFKPHSHWSFSCSKLLRFGYAKNIYCLWKQASLLRETTSVNATRYIKILKLFGLNLQRNWAYLRRCKWSNIGEITWSHCWSSKVMWMSVAAAASSSCRRLTARHKLTLLPGKITLAFQLVNHGQTQRWLVPVNSVIRLGYFLMFWAKKIMQKLPKYFDTLGNRYWK